MLRVIGVIVLLAVVVVLGLAAGKPDHFRVQRSASIDAPPERIYTLINDFHRWSAWSPYEHKDRDMKRSFSGAGSGGSTPFVGKIMHVFLDMDRMVGTEFEAGLANLKSAVERGPARSAS